jgi:hypothetical protein
MSGMTKTLERKKSPLLFLMLKGEGHGGIDVGQILRLDLRIMVWTPPLRTASRCAKLDD